MKSLTRVQSCASQANVGATIATHPSALPLSPLERTSSGLEFKSPGTCLPIRRTRFRVETHARRAERTSIIIVRDDHSIFDLLSWSLTRTRTSDDASISLLRLDKYVTRAPFCARVLIVCVISGSDEIFQRAPSFSNRSTVRAGLLSLGSLR